GDERDRAMPSSGGAGGGGGLARNFRAGILQNLLFRSRGLNHSDRRAESDMTTDHLIDLKALLVGRPDRDAGQVQQLRNAVAQGGGQYRALRDVTDLLKKKLESATGAQAKTWHLKIGIASYFLGYTQQAIEHLRQADTALAGFYLGRALMSRGTDERSE